MNDTTNNMHTSKRRTHIDINGVDVRQWAGYRADRVNRILTSDYAQDALARGVGSHLSTPPVYYVVVVDGDAAGLDTAGGRWQDVCDYHGGVCSHETLALALRFASTPEDWCELCTGRLAEQAADEVV